jgi:periplasmic copper chaperone A
MSICHALLPSHLTLRASHRHPRTITVVCGLVAISAALVLAGCGGNADDAPAAKATSSTTAASPLTIENAWVKTADSGMTAVFGQLRNTGGSSITVISAATSVSSRTELHEVVMVGGAMQMRPKKGGFVVRPGAAYPLAPGGNHLMLVGLKAPIRPGDKIDVELSVADGSSVKFSALAKSSSGGKETYAPGQSPMPKMGTPSSVPSSDVAR